MGNLGYTYNGSSLLTNWAAVNVPFVNDRFPNICKQDGCH